MSTQMRNAHQNQTMLERSKNWLAATPSQPEIKQALAAIVAKVTKGDLPNSDDCRETCDALTQHYVDIGGDLCDLPSLPDLGSAAAAPAVPINPTSVESSGLDYGSLYPADTPAVAPLSFEEKQMRFAQLRASIGRPGGFQ